MNLGQTVIKESSRTICFKREDLFYRMYATRGLLVAITAQLLLFSGVHSGPLHSSEDAQVPDESAKSEGSIMLEGQGVEDYVEVGEPSEFYLQEVREQVEAQRMAEEETQTERDTRSTCLNPSESD